MNDQIKIPWQGWAAALGIAAIFWSVVGVGCARLHAAYKQAEIETVIMEWGLDSKRDIFQP